MLLISDYGATGMVEIAAIAMESSEIGATYWV